MVYSLSGRKEEKGKKSITLQISKQISDQAMPNLRFYSQTQHVYYTGLVLYNDFMANISFTKEFPESAH